MKTKLISSKDDEFIGYRNIFYKDVDQIPNNSCFELYCGQEITKLILNDDFSRFMKTCCNKIRHQGVIVVCGPDFDQISLSYIYKRLNEKEISKFLSDSVGFYNCRLVEKELKNNRLKINAMAIENHNFFVRGFRE